MAQRVHQGNIVPQGGCRTNIFTRSKGLAAEAAKTECTKITLGS